ncbi:MAG: hypothetical protein N3G21_12645 [Candidatus Hydrogenedentes bacterium]|nr:hypothetical protein [Candidatus Hydrogenedentota bacterium]
MAFGDVGGTYTELIITCRTPDSGMVNIRKGDAVKIIGNYEVTNSMNNDDPIFGQAMSDCNQPDTAIPIKVRGVCVFQYEGGVPIIDGVKGVSGSVVAGRVKSPAVGNGFGRVVKIEPGNKRVHVLL